MVHADQKNKVHLMWEDDLQRSEDYLTSTFFGMLNYLPTQLILNALLPESGVEYDEGYHHQFEFWPRDSFLVYWHEQVQHKTTEPDLIIHTPSAIIIVEAKYRSRLGDDETQLPRQLLWACKLALTTDKPIFNIAVTADNIDPLPDIKDMIRLWCDQISTQFLDTMKIERENLRTYLDRLAWISWYELYKRIEMVSSEYTLPHLPYLLEDLRVLCQLRDMSLFEGFADQAAVSPNLRWSLKQIDFSSDIVFLPQVSVSRNLRWRLSPSSDVLFSDNAIYINPTFNWRLNR